MSQLRQRVVWGVLLVLLVGHSMSGALNLAAQSAEAQRQYEEGERFYDEARVAEAIAAFTRAIELEPAFTAAYVGRARAYRSLDVYDTAMVDINRALELAPDDVDALLTQSALFADRDDAVAALAGYNRVLELDPNNADAYASRGRLSYLAGDYAAALLDYDRAVELDDRSARALLGRGTVHMQTGDLTAALADFNGALAIDRNNLQVYFNRGLVYMRLQDYELAAADFEEVVKGNPEHANAHWAIGNAYYQQGLLWEARVAYETYLELTGDAADPFVAERLAEMDARGGN